MSAFLGIYKGKPVKAELVPAYNRASEEEVELFKKLRSRGLSFQQIAKHTKRAASTVHKHAKDVEVEYLDSPFHGGLEVHPQTPYYVLYEGDSIRCEGTIYDINRSTGLKISYLRWILYNPWGSSYELVRLGTAEEDYERIREVRGL